MATDHDPTSEPPDQVGGRVAAGIDSGDVAGLDQFVEWMVDHPDECGMKPSTLQHLRSAWRVVRDQLALPPQLTLTELDPDELMDRFCDRRGTAFRSRATYRTRLRCAVRMYREWLTGEPDWQRRLPRRRRRTTPKQPDQSTHVMTFPLRPRMTIAVELPVDLKPAEAELLGGWLRNHVVARR